MQRSSRRCSNKTALLHNRCSIRRVLLNYQICKRNWEQRRRTLKVRKDIRLKSMIIQTFAHIVISFFLHCLPLIVALSTDNETLSSIAAILFKLAPLHCAFIYGWRRKGFRQQVIVQVRVFLIISSISGNAANVLSVK